MNEIAVLDQQEIDNALARIEILSELLVAQTTQGNVSLKKEASLNLAKISKLLDGKRAEAVKPALEEQRRINAVFKPVIDKLDSISKALINQVAEFVRIEERKVQEQRALQAKQDAEALLAQKPVSPKAEIEAPSVTVSETKYWTYDIDNIEIEKLPHEYLQPDYKAIDAAIRAGKRHIPGLKIYQKIIVGRR